LAGLAIVDTVLIVILVLEMSVVGVFMKKEPLWYIISYPYIIHPGRGIVQVSLNSEKLILKARFCHFLNKNSQNSTIFSFNIHFWTKNLPNFYPP
jgi:hypothetical protein